jgi:trans-aconitate methyltransferase
MSDQSPALHTRFEDERTRPAAELLERVLLGTPARDVDMHLAEYQSRIEGAYPAHADGKRLLAFPRLFIVARRRDS